MTSASPTGQISNSLDTSRKIAIGTASGVVVRFAGMPLEAVFVKRSFHDNTKSYLEGASRVPPTGVSPMVLHFYVLNG